MFGNSLTRERVYPYILALLLAGVAYQYQFDLSKYQTDVLDNSTTITSIFIGFLGTLAGIVFGSNTKAIRFMRKINKLSGFYSYSWAAINWSFAFLVYNIFLQLSPSTLRISALYTTAWAFLGALSLLLTYRFITISIKLLHASVNEQ